MHWITANNFNWSIRAGQYSFNVLKSGDWKPFCWIKAFCILTFHHREKSVRFLFLKRLTPNFCPSQDSHFPPIGRVIMPRPAMCHTSSLQTPIDKDQALQVSVSAFTPVLTLLFASMCFNHILFSFVFNTFPTVSYTSNWMSTLQAHVKYIIFQRPL